MDWLPGITTVGKHYAVVCIVLVTMHLSTVVTIVLVTTSHQWLYLVTSPYILTGITNHSLSHASLQPRLCVGAWYTRHTPTN